METTLATSPTKPFRLNKKEPLWFVVFVCAYYLPMAMDGTTSIIKDQRAQQLFEQVTNTPAVRMDIATNILTHLALLVLVYGLLVSLASMVSKVGHIKPWIPAR